MNALRRRPTTKNWARFAMKLGLLATDAAVWSSIARMITDRDEATDIRRERIASNLSPNRGWSHASTLFIGVAIGVGWVCFLLRCQENKHVTPSVTRPRI